MRRGGDKPSSVCFLCATVCGLGRRWGARGGLAYASDGPLAPAQCKGDLVPGV